MSAARVDAVQFLLEHDANANVVHPAMGSALTQAALMADADIVDLLLTHGAERGARDRAEFSLGDCLDHDLPALHRPIRTRRGGQPQIVRREIQAVQVARDCPIRRQDDEASRMGVLVLVGIVDAEGDLAAQRIGRA